MLFELISSFEIDAVVNEQQSVDVDRFTTNMLARITKESSEVEQQIVATDERIAEISGEATATTMVARMTLIVALILHVKGALPKNLGAAMRVLHEEIGDAGDERSFLLGFRDRMQSAYPLLWNWIDRLIGHTWDDRFRNARGYTEVITLMMLRVFEIGYMLESNAELLAYVSDVSHTAGIIDEGRRNMERHIGQYLKKR